ncbi:hypothetical protein ABEB36_007332 [Hypothenemus hampei]|uniref:Angiogenic factor with G patch and FHA domains 1 n=1 Tax=Hypothenemus hampei TaxID=57062 RepID=A0ABD1EU53_HYPHA
MYLAMDSEILPNCERVNEVSIKSESLTTNSIDDSFPEALNEVQTSVQMDDELKEKIKDLPEVVQFIERLQKVIQKQVKKIIKWKMKAKKLQKHVRNISTQTQSEEIMDNIETDDKKEKTLAENIQEAAEEALQSSGFVYEETSGLYYDYNSGYYYNAEYGLYYDGTTGTYLKYNQETNTYDFHSQVECIETKRKDDIKSSTKKRRSKSNKSKDTKRPRKTHSNKDFEEGECSDSSSSWDDNCSSSEKNITTQWPPCMRMIVESTEIPKIKPGTLYVITCDGGTIGREGDHSVCLPDINVSKHHLKITYNSETRNYEIVDLGSRNGTFLNGKRMSSSKQESEPTEICHGSKLKLGSTMLLCHVHDGTQTCGHCEPGLLIAEEKVQHLSKKNINQQFKSELRRLRKQHGLLGSYEDSTKLGKGYTDRAEKRRIEVGSQNPYEKTEFASVDTSISSENKGFKLLAKMGWKEGESLGKDGSGVKEPVKVVANSGTTGIGSENSAPSISNTLTTKENIWKKAQERFEKLPEHVDLTSDLDNSS